MLNKIIREFGGIQTSKVLAVKSWKPAFGSHKKEGAATHSCNPRFEESEAGGIPGAGFPASFDKLVNSRFRKTPCLKHEGGDLHSPFFPPYSGPSLIPSSAEHQNTAVASSFSYPPSPADLLYISPPSHPFISLGHSLEPEELTIREAGKQLNREMTSQSKPTEQVFAEYFTQTPKDIPSSQHVVGTSPK